MSANNEQGSPLSFGADVLRDVQMDGVEFFRVSAEAPFNQSLAAGALSYCVIVRTGEFQLEVDFPQIASINLRPGDVVAISGLASFAFRTEPESGPLRRIVPLPMNTLAEGDVHLIVGVVPHAALALGSLLAGPIVVRTQSDPDLARQIGRAADMLEDEYRSPQEDGRTLIVRRLAELILISMTRRLLRQGREAPREPTRERAERKIVHALNAVFDAPEKAWDLPSMAAQAGMSRTRFADSFKALTGQTPAHLVTRFRLAAAARRLINENLTVGAAAEQSGYGSAAAFVRAFQREHGETPARWRRRQISAQTDAHPLKPRDPKDET